MSESLVSKEFIDVNKKYFTAMTALPHYPFSSEKTEQKNRTRRQSYGGCKKQDFTEMSSELIEYS